MTIEGVAFLGMRIADPAAYASTVAMYRDALGLTVTTDDGLRSVRFVLGDETALHVYGPQDVDHLEFGDRLCVGYRVADIASALDALRAAGIELLDDPGQADGTEAWCHIRTPDGAVHEIVGPDPAAETTAAGPLRP
jgi:catechol 2,3-dioxygenase-like lactoylglutathione lyase family enzyme